MAYLEGMISSGSLFFFFFSKSREKKVLAALLPVHILYHRKGLRMIILVSGRLYPGRLDPRRFCPNPGPYASSQNVSSRRVTSRLVARETNFNFNWKKVFGSVCKSSRLAAYFSQLLKYV